ncbi:MAG: hypothetical protein HY858_09150 [Candidatus Solibacter usitatus]|nr:hypothetical protein [Candidatus Solibacter usitatus]
MMRSIDGSADRFLGSLRVINARLERAERRVASGKRLTTASDDPDAVARLLQTRTDVSRMEQTQTNLGRLKTEADGAESALQTAVKLFDRVRTLGMTGASGIHTALTRKGIADEIGSIMERLAGLANTQVDGRFIFSGDSDQGAAFDFDLAQNPPWSAYLGAPATREAMHPTGVTFPVAMTAGEILTSAQPGLDVFQAAENLRQALLANDEAGMKAALEPLAGVSAHLNSALTFYGNVQSQLEEATDTTAKLKTRLTTEKAQLEDADIAEEIVELQRMKFNQQAALEVRSKLPQTSLFDYLG